jgi:hypothetical protein
MRQNDNRYENQGPRRIEACGGGGAAREALSWDLFPELTLLYSLHILSFIPPCPLFLDPVAYPADGIKALQRVQFPLTTLLERIFLLA